MGLIRESIELSSNKDMVLEVIEHTHDESYEPWHIIGLSIDDWSELTPVELRKLGHRLVKESLRIGREYTSKGSRRIRP
jgi:hypothetical protein